MARPDWLDPAWGDVRASHFQGWNLTAGDDTPLGSITSYTGLPSWTAKLPNPNPNDWPPMYATETEAARYLVEHHQAEVAERYGETESAPDDWDGSDW